MKKSFCSIAVMAMLLGGAFTSCKTTEANYAAAYQIAREKKDAALTADERAALNREEARATTIYNGDSIPLRAMRVTHVEGAKPQRYTVVAATFKQIFNSRSVFGRLRDAGGMWQSPLILQNPSDKRYYVGAYTTSSLDSAVTALHSLQTSSPVQMASPCPFILSR